MMDNINKSLEKSIFSQEGKDLAVDYSEIALDKILDSDLLNEIPIIKSVLGLYKIGLGIRERHLVKKIAKFLFQLQDIPQVEKDKFLSSLATNAKMKDEVLEKLILLLERLDDTEKAMIVGNLFKATINGNVNIDDFQKLCSIIDRGYIRDLKSFCIRNHPDTYDNFNIVSKYSYNSEVKKNLASLGLLTEEIDEKEDVAHNMRNGKNKKYKYSFKYRITDLGSILIKSGLDN